MAGLSDILARQAHVRRRLDALAAHPPQSLVLEGGLAPEREALALYGAMRLNCPSQEPPCLTCPVCRQIEDKVFRDLHFLAGGAGAGESITIDMIRELRPVWGQPPHGQGFRVTILHEAQHLGTEAANALLKSLEEPRPGNVFILAAPQRERLLPTLVSRSFILTLAWPDAVEPGPEAARLAGAMVGYWETGRGWFEHTMGKGALDRNQANAVLLALMRAERDALTGRTTPEGGRLAALFDAACLRRLDLALGQAQEALTAQAGPALVLDWLATRLRG